MKNAEPFLGVRRSGESKFTLRQLPSARWSGQKAVGIIYDDNQRKTDPRMVSANTLALFERELVNLENRPSIA
jgi:hypothetical protein